MPDIGRGPRKTPGRKPSSRCFPNLACVLSRQDVVHVETAGSAEIERVNGDRDSK